MAFETIGVRQPLPGVVYPPAIELENYVRAGALRHETWPEAMAEVCRTHSARHAVVGSDGPITYAELDEQTTKSAAALVRLGLRPNDRVIFQIGNSKELLLAFLGCVKAGLIPICTLAAHREHEIGFLANHAAARAHIVQGDDPTFDHVGFANNLRAQIPSMHAVISTRGSARPGVPRLEDLAAEIDVTEARRVLADVPRDPFQVAVMQLSGGTSGVPKLIPRFHNEYVYNMRAVAGFLDYRSTDVMLMPMPMIHNASMCCAWGPILLMGGTFIITSQPSVDVLASTIRDHKPTWLGLGQRELILRCQQAMQVEQLPLQQVRGVWAINSASLVREELGLPSQHIFGMSEGLIMFTRATDPLEIRETTIGQPVSPLDRVRILRPGTEDEVEPGEIGELVVQGPYTTHGYYDAPDRNKVAFTSRGEYRSGDLVSARVANGPPHYVYEGRLKDVIDRGGEKISSEEIELALALHPAVAEIAVVAIPDARLGERLCACVMARDAQRAADLSVAGLAVFLQQLGVAKFKWPERVEVFETLPRTKVGKVDKSILRRLATERADRAAEAKST